VSTSALIDPRRDSHCSSGWERKILRFCNPFIWLMATVLHCLGIFTVGFPYVARCSSFPLLAGESTFPIAGVPHLCDPVSTRHPSLAFERAAVFFVKTYGHGTLRMSFLEVLCGSSNLLYLRIFLEAQICRPFSFRFPLRRFLSAARISYNFGQVGPELRLAFYVAPFNTFRMFNK